MGLVARELERRGIATVCLSLLPEVAEKVRPPRSLAVPFGWGQPLGPPGHGDVHRRVVREALEMLYADTAPAEIRELERAPDRGGEG